jgi:LuxR family maltose regulon positive regulatory protein
MPAPILATKLYLPLPRPGIVPRPRLVERLNESLAAGRKLALISASAGFGKTTLVSEWISTLTPAPSNLTGTRPSGRGTAVRVAWFSLDEGDNDLSRFLTYLVASLQTITKDIGKGVLEAIQTSQPLTTINEFLLATLLNEIAAIPGNFILVLDDYHVIDAQPVDQTLSFLLDHLPPRMRLVITTREDPSLPLARLRARGQLTELRASDLRFTPAEATDFLNQVMGLNLRDADIAALEARTEGWIAGLQLAALSMQGRSDTAGFIQAFTGSHRFVLDYLVEEVLQHQFEPIRSFLLQTAILDRLSAPLCNAVTEREDGKEILDILERNNLFLIPLDDERQWYRYHHLFADVLQAHLMKVQPDQVATLHQRASAWYEQIGSPSDAIRHALAGKDFERASRLIELTYPAMDSSFQSAAWLGWVQKLPEEVIRVRPVLCTQAAYALTDTGEVEASKSRLQEAELCLNGSPDGMVVADEEQLKPLPAMIAIAYAGNAHIEGDLSAAVKYVEMALQLIPEDDLFRRAQATVILEFTHWASGDLEAAYQSMRDWMNSMEKAGNMFFAVASAFAVADILIEQGRLREAVRTYRQSLQLASVHGQEVQQITAHHYLGLGMLSHEMGDGDAAAQYLQKARELGEQTTLIDWPYRWYLAQSRLKQDGGDLETALTLLDEARRVYVKNPLPDTRPIESLKVRLYLRQGRLTEARNWAHERELPADNDLTYLREFEHITMARVLIVEYQRNRTEPSILQALRLLERLLKVAEGQSRMGSTIEILVTQALAHQAQGNLPLAFTALDRVLALAEPEGYVRLFVDEGEPMRMLIANYRFSLEKQISSRAHTPLGYTDKLLAAFALPANQQSTTPALSAGGSVKNPKQEMLEPLSDRELEVLRLVAQGLTNDQISQRLVLALSTVKGHNLRIFGKLQAQNRSEAVARARELGLL